MLLILLAGTALLGWYGATAHRRRWLGLLMLAPLLLLALGCVAVAGMLLVTSWQANMLSLPVLGGVGMCLLVVGAAFWLWRLWRGSGAAAGD